MSIQTEQQQNTRREILEKRFNNKCVNVYMCGCRNRNSSQLSRKRVTSVVSWVTAECCGLQYFCGCVCVYEKRERVQTENHHVCL